MKTRQVQGIFNKKYSVIIDPTDKTFQYGDFFLFMKYTVQEMGKVEGVVGNNNVLYNGKLYDIHDISKIIVKQEQLSYLDMVGKNEDGTKVLVEYPVNQCDGCQKNMPLNDSNLHIDPITNRIHCVCTKNQYNQPILNEKGFAIVTIDKDLKPNTELKSDKITDVLKNLMTMRCHMMFTEGTPCYSDGACDGHCKFFKNTVKELQNL